MKLPKAEYGLVLEIDPHKVYHQTVREYAEEFGVDDWDWESEEAKARCLAGDTFCTLHWYPTSTVGFNQIAAATLPELLSLAEKVEAGNE